MRSRAVTVAVVAVGCALGGCKRQSAPSGTAVASSTPVAAAPLQPVPRPAEVKVDAVVCKAVKDGEAVDATDHFARTSAPVHVVWHATWVQGGTQVMGRWFSDGAAAGAGAGGGARPMQIMERSVVVDGPSGAARGALSLEPPPEGWPAGRYHVDLLFDGAQVASVPFQVE